MPRPVLPGFPPAGGGPLLRVDLTRWRTADLALVDLLARLCLQAGRLGARIVVHPGDSGLGALLEMTGLGGIVSLAGSELRGQAETLEQAGVEEVVDVRDPSVAQFEDLQGPGLEPSAGAAGLVLGESRRAVELDGEQA